MILWIVASLLILIAAASVWYALRFPDPNRSKISFIFAGVFAVASLVVGFLASRKGLPPTGGVSPGKTTPPEDPKNTGGIVGIPPVLSPTPQEIVDVDKQAVATDKQLEKIQENEDATKPTDSSNHAIYGSRFRKRADALPRTGAPK